MNRLPVCFLVLVAVCQFSYKLPGKFPLHSLTCIAHGIKLDSIPPDTITEAEMNKMDIGDVESVAADPDHNVVHIKLKNGRNYVMLITKELENRADSITRANNIADRQKNLPVIGNIRTHVEIESEYPGGITAWYRFLQKTLVYPDEAVRNEIQGQVVVKFIVGVDGRTSDIKAISGPLELRAEAVRVVKKSGTWVPAVQNGIKVESYKSQPINFKLEFANLPDNPQRF